MEERPQQFGATPNPCETVLHHVLQLLHGGGGVITPLLFDRAMAVCLRMEIRGLGRPQFAVDLRMGGQKLRHGLSLRAACPSPHHDERTGEAAAQVVQERDERLSRNRVGVGQVEDGAGGGQTHERGPFPAFRAAAQAGGASPRCPSRPHGRAKREAGFVNEDEGRPQPAGFFLIRGQSWWRQGAIGAAARSRACPPGCCRLPSPRRNRRRMWTTLYQRPWVRPIPVRIRPNVHRSVSNPNAPAPRRRTARMAWCWAGLNAAGRPEACRIRHPRSPVCWTGLAHLLTVASLTPKRRAMAAWRRGPRCKRRPPAPRRSAIWARVKVDGCQLMPPVYSRLFSLLTNLGKTQ
jgi:hypothetical protein